MTASSASTSDRPAFFDQLVATVEQLSATRSALRQIISLADGAPGLTDTQLRDRLLALADHARYGSTIPTDSRPATG